ncbi:MAG: glutamine synthetase [Parcubacteria group bacterium Gr01-1014_107]|nr:MAG: glutamine synthetase [Parcubacteria group bacterium Gr01-1014_107]
MGKIRAEYIWIDGQRPTAKMRSKTKIIDDPVGKLERIPDWGFDGSSTFQAETHKSDCMLRPVFYVPDPVRGKPNLLVLCEVFLPDGEPHPSNTRAELRKAVEETQEHEPLFGVEQEYTLYDLDGVRPLRWPEGAGFPAPQGKYYCGVGCDEVYGRELVEAHTKACLEAEIAIYGTNGEVMPSQWEFQIGPLPPPAIADHVWLARWLLYRLGENFGISAKLSPKPIGGDWNGAGAHVNFSTEKMRGGPPGSIVVIYTACERLGEFHQAHIADHVYGENNHLRLTGRHETASIDTFRYAVGDRGASIRIPAGVYLKGCGYLEDRRPAANMDPYRVLTALLQTVCGQGFDPDVFSYFRAEK